MTPQQALACIEQERLDVMAEGMTEDECQNVAAYVLASEYRKLKSTPSASEPICPGWHRDEPADYCQYCGRQARQRR